MLQLSAETIAYLCGHSAIFQAHRLLFFIYVFTIYWYLHNLLSRKIESVCLRVKARTGNVRLVKDLS